MPDSGQIIPQNNTICNLLQLKKLNIQHNSLIHLPDDIGNLKELVHLNLNNNKLESLPSSIGHLKNLQILDISDNNLSRLPEEIANLTNLKTFNAINNKLPLPENHAQLSPQDLIKHILEKQPRREPELRINKIHLFRNIGDTPKFKNAYFTNLNAALNERKIEFAEIDNIDVLCGDIPIVFLLVPFDLHQNQNMIFDMIEKCRSNNYKYYILIQKLEHANGLINLTKGKEIDQLHGELKKKYPERIVYFENAEDVSNIIAEALNSLIFVENCATDQSRFTVRKEGLGL